MPILRACKHGVINYRGRCAECERDTYRTRKRRGQRTGSTPAWRALRKRVLARDAHTCHYCGKTANTVDHLVPVVDGGIDHESNCVAACARCNGRKGRRRFFPASPLSPAPPVSRTGFDG